MEEWDAVLRQAQGGEQVVEPPDLNMMVEIGTAASFSLRARLAGAGKSCSQDFQVLAFLDVAHEQVFVLLRV